MKLIAKTIPNSKKYYWKQLGISILIVLTYIIGITTYVALFLLPSYFFANQPLHTLDWNWLLVPVLSFVIACLHLYYRYKGSLKTRSIVMFILFLIIFFVPLIILFLF